MRYDWRKKISKALKKYYQTHKPWSFDKKYGKYYEPASKRLRRDKDYYLKELEKNAKRSWKLAPSEKRVKQIKELRKIRVNKAGFYNRRKWSKEEEDILKENINLSYLEIALKLNRSLSSVEHKKTRLGLIKNNKLKK